MNRTHPRVCPNHVQREVSEQKNRWLGIFQQSRLLLRNADLLKLKGKFSWGGKQPAHHSCVPDGNPSNIGALHSVPFPPSSLGDVVLWATLQSISFPPWPPITTTLPGIGKKVSYGGLWGEIQAFYYLQTRNSWMPLGYNENFSNSETLKG